MSHLKNGMPLRFSLILPVLLWLTACAMGGANDSTSTLRFVAAERALAAGEYRLAAREYRKAALASTEPATLRAAADVSYEFGSNAHTRDILAHWQTVVPADPAPWLIRGELALRAADLDAATAAFNRHIELAVPPYSDREEAFEHVGAALTGAGDQRLALAIAEAVARAYPDEWRAQRVVSQVAASREDLTRSLEAAELAFELAPDSFAAGMLQAQAIILGGDRSAGLEFAAEIAATAGSLDDRLDYARLLSSSDSVDEAVEIVDAVLEAAPDNADALQARAILDIRAGEVERAWERFSLLVAKPSHRHDALFFLANIAERGGRTEQARRIYAQIGEGPNAVIAQQRISALLFGAGDPDAALASLERYTRQHPEGGFALQLTRAQIYREVGRHDDAIALYDKLLAIRPESEGLKLSRAEALIAADKLDAAIEQYRRSLDAHPDSALSLNALGYTLADRTEEFDEAYTLIGRALELEPDNPAIIDSMGWVEFKLGNLDAALMHLERAWEMIKDPEVAAHLGETLWRLGERDRAREILKEAYDRNPDSLPLRRTLERLLELDALVES